eukprot:scaffold1679_cov127-Isochrysis_galbana.AAC.1
MCRGVWRRRAVGLWQKTLVTTGIRAPRGLGCLCCFSLFHSALGNCTPHTMIPAAPVLRISSPRAARTTTLHPEPDSAG